MNHVNEEQHEQRQERSEIRRIIGEKTPVQLGVTAAFYVFSFGLVVASVWWAATLTEKINTVLKNQDAQNITMSAMQADISDLKAWRKVIDTSGSPQAASLSKEINDLKRELEVHIAETGKSKL
jgi:hypothetical protein